MTGRSRIQLSNSPYVRTRTCIIAPFFVRPRRAAHFFSVSPNGACGTRGREAASAAAREPGGLPHTVRENQRHTGGGPARRVRSSRLNRGNGRSFSPAFRTRMDLSACWMSQGLLLPPTRPVRANCRPDMHSSRPLALPWSAPSAPFGPEILEVASGPGKVRGPPRPVPRRETIAGALRIGTGCEESTPDLCQILSVVFRQIRKSSLRGTDSRSKNGVASLAYGRRSNPAERRQAHTKNAEFAAP